MTGTIIWTIVILSGLGLLLAVVLFLVAKKFKVEEDPRIDEVEKVMTGANCGGCGFAGCRAFACHTKAGIACVRIVKWRNYCRVFTSCLFADVARKLKSHSRPSSSSPTPCPDGWRQGRNRQSIRFQHGLR